MMHARYRTGAYGNYTLELYSLVGHSCLLQRSYRWHDRRIIRGRATARPKSSCAAGQWSRTSAWTATCTPYTPAACKRRQREGEDTATAQTHQPDLFRIGVSPARAIYLRAIPTTPVRCPFPPRLLRRAKLGERSTQAGSHFDPHRCPFVLYDLRGRLEGHDDLRIPPGKSRTRVTVARTVLHSTRRASASRPRKDRSDSFL
jgi:hypothetical protein